MIESVSLQFCKHCEKTYPHTEEFFTPNGHGDKLRKICERCRNTVGRLRYELRVKYGITLEYYNWLLKLQNGVCAICKQPPIPGGKYCYSRLNVDHSHSTGRVRALLCAACNKGLGHLNDDPDRVKAALDYLLMHERGIYPVSAGPDQLARLLQEPVL